MNPQISIDFTASPINRESIEKQNQRLINYLNTYPTINFMEARRMGIGFLNSRCSDLKKKGVIIYSRWTKIKAIKCKEYSFKPFEK